MIYKFPKTLGFIALFSVLPYTVSAQTGTSQTPDIAKQMQMLLDQYSDKIRTLEAENKLLRATMAKYEIQIPLADYNAVLSGTGDIAKAVANATKNTTSALATTQTSSASAIGTT